MARPPKYETPYAAAVGYVLGRLKLAKESFVLTQQPCHVCSAKPMELEHVRRADGEYKLWYNRVMNGLTICKLCQAMMKIATVEEIRSYAARVLAKRKHELDTKWVSTAQEKPIERT